MDIRQLRRFVTIAELGSFNKAADQLAVSQPSLSRSITMLEDTLDVKLFERGARGIELTPAGKELLPHARVILNERDNAMSAINGLRQVREECIAIGTEPMFAMHRLPLALAHMFNHHPNIQITVQEGTLNDMLDQVRDGSLRLVLGSKAPYLKLDGISFEQLSMEGASVLMSAQHPLAKKENPTLKELSDARWIVPTNTTLMQGWTQMFQSHDVDVPTIALRTSSLLLTKSCLLYSELVSMGNHEDYAEDIAAGKLVRMDFGTSGYERPAGIFWRSEAVLSRTEKTLIKTLCNICQ